jgi:hypothetical protein
MTRRGWPMSDAPACSEMYGIELVSGRGDAEVEERRRTSPLTAPRFPIEGEHFDVVCGELKLYLQDILEVVKSSAVASYG